MREQGELLRWVRVLREEKERRIQKVIKRLDLGLLRTDHAQYSKL